MAPNPSDDIVETLEKSRAALHAAAAGLSEAQAAERPGAGRWSALECVEHVATVEERFLGLVAGARRLETPAADRQREEDLTARLTDRGNRREAPEPARPAGRFATLAEALNAFNAVRGRSLQVARERGAELYSLTAHHHRFGDLNGHEILLIVAGHAARHAAQIREMRERRA